MTNFKVKLLRNSNYNVIYRQVIWVQTRVGSYEVNISQKWLKLTPNICLNVCQGRNNYVIARLGSYEVKNGWNLLQTYVSNLDPEIEMEYWIHEVVLLPSSRFCHQANFSEKFLLCTIFLLTPVISRFRAVFSTVK